MAQTSVSLPKNEVSAKPRLGWVDSLRAVAMVAIVFGHVEGVPEWVNLVTYSFHVPMFFMLSGALARPGKFQTWGACVAHQVRYILLLYFLLSYVCVPLWYVNWKVLDDSDIKMGELLLSPLVANGQILGMPNNALWFLPVLFLTAVIGWWFLRLLSRRIDLMMVAILALLGLAAGLSKYHSHYELPWHLDVVPIALFYYLLGFLLMQPAKSLSQWTTSQPGPTRALLVVTGAALVGIGIVAADSTNNTMSLMRNDLGGFPVGILASLVEICGYAIALMALPRIPLLEWYGRVTMGTLAFHVPITRFLQNWSVTDGFYAENPIWIGLFVTVITGPVNWVVYRYLPWLVGARPGGGSRARHGVSAAKHR